MDIHDQGSKNREGATSCRFSLPEQPVSSALALETLLVWALRIKLRVEVGWTVLRLDTAGSSLWSGKPISFPNL